jgi:hypothetical protein
MTKRSPISNLPAAFAMVVCLGFAACGELDPAMLGTGGTGGSGGIGDMSQLFPLKTGNSWTYTVTYTSAESGVSVIPKTQTVMGEEPVGGTGPNAGVTAFRMVTRKRTDGTLLTVSWQARVGTRIVRYREQAFFGDAPYALKREDHWDPAKLRVDETPDHLVTGATWLETSLQTRMPVASGGTPYTDELDDTWTVVAERQPVTVHGRSYEVLILEKTGADRKTYWWARGIGKVKEVGPDGLEELVSYSLVP